LSCGGIRAQICRDEQGENSSGKPQQIHNSPFCVIRELNLRRQPLRGIQEIKVIETGESKLS